MPVEGILSKSVETCRPEDTLEQVAQKMSEHGISSLVVVTDDGGVISTITDLDIAIAASIEGRKLIDLTVRELTSRELSLDGGTLTPVAAPRATSSRRAQR